MTDLEPLVTEQQLARTYDGGDYDDAWAAVEQYRRAVTYHRDNPDAEIGELMRVSGAPRDPVVSWINEGATPPVVQGLYKAHNHRLIGVTYDEVTPLNVLVAHAFSAGTVGSHNHQPMFTVTSPGESMIATTLELIGVGYQELDNGSVESNPAIGPAEDAAVLGRVLSVLGVPVGSKAQQTDLSLPWYLEDAPESVRKRFVNIYLQNRGKPKYDSAGVQITEDRSRPYREELAELIESVAGEPVTATDSCVMVSADAARALGFEPETVA